MDAVAVYSVSTLAWLGVQAVPLVVWPSFVASLLAPDYHVDAVAVYFARALGFAQLALGLVVVVLSGLLPLGDVAATTSAPLDGPATAPYATAAVLVSTLYHAAAAFYSYGSYYTVLTPQLAAYAVGCAGSSSLATLGLWCLLFGSDKGHISCRTGADKRTSNFPFTNAAAAHQRKLK